MLFVCREKPELPFFFHQLFLSLHSYSQLWLIPEDASYKRMPDYQDMYNKALLAVRALRRVRNTKYQIGTASDLLYTISGRRRVGGVACLPGAAAPECGLTEYPG